jgi:predicted DNA-binding transcriptional regulator
MKTDTARKIIDFIKQHGQATAYQIEEYLGISPQAVFRQLSKLIHQGQLAKIGKPPKVFYFIATALKPQPQKEISTQVREKIEKNFYAITPSGQPMSGWEAFDYWCRKQNLNALKTAGEYIETLKKYDAFKNDGLIDGMHKMRTTFKEVFLDHLYYLDFYAIERFGKTKLGQWLLYAKQTQNRSQIHQLADFMKPAVERLIRKHDIGAVGFIPPTVKREVQLMKELQKRLKLKNPSIPIVKIKTPVIVPQKTLNKLEDRVENAAKTIIVDEEQTYENVLLIDDAVGSGATFNETARQIKQKGICAKELVGLAITGSFKGFDVISEI